MGETMVGLEGPATSLAKMSARFSTPRIAISDEGNGMGYLKSSDFPWSEDDAPVFEVANRLVRIANGIMRHEDSRFFQPVRVRPMVLREDDDGERTLRISVSQAAAIGTAEAVTVVERFPDGTTRVITAPAEPPQPSFEDVVLALSGEDSVVDALGFYAYSDDWAGNLFKVYEIVGLDVAETKRGRKSTLGDNRQQLIARGWDEIARLGWTTKDEVTRFRRTVHSPDVLAGQARHAVQTMPAPPHPMTEDEAKEFIGTMLDKWLRQKQAEQPQGQGWT